MRIITALLINLLVLAPLALAQDGRQLTQEKGAVNSDKRIALVIGNAAYTKAKPLANPANDAADMAAELKLLGFEVISGTNQNKRQMETLIREFGVKLAGGGTGLFYYAGHGIQVNGSNYLVPVDAEIPEEDEVQYQAVPLDMVLTKMTTAKNDLNIIILDACRNNPFARSWRGYRDSSNNDGLAKISPPTGTLVLYATEPGKTASDGAGRNGLFTESLLKQIKTPNVEYDQMVKALSADVWQRSNRQQLPWKEGNSLADFYFVRRQAAAKSDTGKIETPVKNETVVAKDAAAVEREAWSYIKDSQNPQDFRDFLKDFPAGANAVNAKIRLEQAVWDGIKDSKDKSKIQAYLNEFPSGANAPLARIRLRQLESPTVTPPSNTGGNPNVTKGAITSGTVRKNSIGMELVYIPPGEFVMGSSESEIDSALSDCRKYYAQCSRALFSDQAPRHRVTVRSGFWISKFELTQGQWEAVMEYNPSRFEQCGTDCPVEQVSWNDIQEFLKRLNAKQDGFQYTLPSEAQWEYAARAGMTTAFAFGDNISPTQANFGPLPPNKTVRVGSYSPNGFGLYDMHGNVWEWVQDVYSIYKGPPSDEAVETSGDPTIGVVRGGAWSLYPSLSRSASRRSLEKWKRENDTGFRVIAKPVND